MDRVLLSADRDRTLHRPPRCPGLRYVHHRWELFNRDVTHPVYVAELPSGAGPDFEAVRQAAKYILPKAKPSLETQPIRFDPGTWAVSVGKWVLRVRVGVAASERSRPTVPSQDNLTPTDEFRPDQRGLRKKPAGPDAVELVAQYFRQNPTACLAIAYYYQDFIQGEVAPTALPIADVAVALDLTAEAAVSEYKKELQRRIWNEQGHQRELGEFLLAHNLIGLAELNRACQIAAVNEVSGRSEQARERLSYRSSKRRAPAQLPEVGRPSARQG
ncbi:MAG TPA: hypothetical protein VFI65_01920 [Streptosporangiaceae bacterium]|nr:hypothetical protein [Streptosporangiaceae bacterium]